MAHRTRSACWSLVATALVCAVTLLIAKTLHAEPAHTASADRRVPVSLWPIPQLGTGLSGEPMETSLAHASPGYHGLAGRLLEQLHEPVPATEDPDDESQDAGRGAHPVPRRPERGGEDARGPRAAGKGRPGVQG